MKKLAILFLPILILFSCGEDKTELKLEFKGLFGEETLSFDKEYTLENDKKIKILQSGMYLSDLRLITKAGKTIKLDDYVHLDFEKNASSIQYSFKEIPQEEFKSLDFGVGLNSDLNKTKPKDYPSNDVMNKSSYYWTAWKSYIFSKLEGKVDNNNDGTFAKGWLFHSGKDEMYRNVSLALDRKFNDENETIKVNFDHKPLFTIDGKTIALEITHDPSDAAFFAKFMDNMKASFSLDK